MNNAYVPPAVNSDRFNCPHCGAFARHVWSALSVTYELHVEASIGAHEGYYNVSVCSSCSRFTFWDDATLLYPLTKVGEPPNPDLPKEIIADYEEASVIAGRSPRAAAALLRLVIQKICRDRGQPGKHLSNDIGALVAEGLEEPVQQALDSVRIVGNNAVHPGKIDLRDDMDTVSTLFSLINYIAQVMYTRPKAAQKLYKSLPKGAREDVARRDGKGQ